MLQNRQIKLLARRRWKLHSKRARKIDPVDIVTDINVKKIDIGEIARMIHTD